LALTKDIGQGFFLLIVIMFFILHQPEPIKPNFVFLIPFPGYVSYPSEYNWFKEIFFRPQSYKTWNSEALINFKWRMYGIYYYIGICLFYTIFFISFIQGSSLETIFFGCIHLLFEIRQFLWDPLKWLLDFWNWFGTYYYLLFL